MTTRPAQTAHGAKAECFVAASSGTARLSGMVRHPVVLIDIAPDADEAVEDLRRRQHGGATLWPRSFQPLRPQRGWDDWALFHLDKASVGSSSPCGARIEDGRIRFSVPDGVTLAEVREQFAGATRHLRFHDVVRHPEWLEAISDKEPMADILVFPRYTVPDRKSFRNAKLCTNLFALDPTERTPLSFGL